MQSRMILYVFLLLGRAVVPGEAHAQDSAAAATPTRGCKVTKAEIEVYKAFFQQEAGGSQGLTVLVTNTDEVGYDVDSVNLQFAAQGHGISPEARADFTRKNKATCSIEPFPGLPSFRFIPRHEENAIFAHGWDEFYRRYGKGSEIVTVSRVGFSVDGNVALVNVTGAIGHNGAAGALYLLKRSEGTWRISFYVQTFTI